MAPVVPSGRSLPVTVRETEAQRGKGVPELLSCPARLRRKPVSQVLGWPPGHICLLGARSCRFHLPAGDTQGGLLGREGDPEGAAAGDRGLEEGAEGGAGLADPHRAPVLGVRFQRSQPDLGERAGTSWGPRLF